MIGLFVSFYHKGTTIPAKMMRLSIFCILVSSIAARSVNQPGNREVEINQGIEFVGIPFDTENEERRNGYAFYGIKYGVAERFQHSKPNNDFTYLQDKSRPPGGYICPQKLILLPNMSPKPGLESSEDCLYLDVYVPSQATRDQKLPVIFWIHGGGFEVAHKNMFQSGLLATDIETVVVTVNYRLNVFGFLSTGDGYAKGNYGVGDLKLAFNWVVENIQHFGGDPKRITITGQSAGGAMTSILMLDENIRKNVRGAVAWSGSTFGQWTRQRDPWKQAQDYADSVGCPKNDSAALVTCFKNVSVEDLIRPEFVDNLMKLHRFSPSVDGVHLNATPSEDVAHVPSNPQNNITFVTGYLREDSSFLHTIMEPELFIPGNVNMPLIKRILKKYLPAGQQCPEQAETSLLQKILDHYEMNENDSSDALLHKFFYATSHILFGYPATKEVAEYAKKTPFEGQSTYLYLISHQLGYQNFGAFHTMEMVFLFRDNWEELVPRELINDRITNSLRLLLRQVAYSELKWKPFGKEGNYYNLNQQLDWEPQSKSFDAYLNFWDQIFAFKCNTTIDI